MTTTEHTRLDEARERKVEWKKWGPYLSERQWGTVREDYSENGDAWNFFTHDQARSRAYRWGEDGLAGISDDKQRLCFALALWNGKDPILKERLFGLTNSEGNHGEDVKEYYFYLDSTPTHSYMKYLYKYPQAAYPYADLVRDEPPAHPRRVRVRTARHRRLRGRPLLRRVRGVRQRRRRRHPGADHGGQPGTGRGRTAPAADAVVPERLVGVDRRVQPSAPGSRTSSRSRRRPGVSAVAANIPVLGEFVLACEGDVPLLFTENETNHERLFPGQQNESRYVKDGINDCVVQGNQDAVNPAGRAPRSRPTTGQPSAPARPRSLRLRLSSASAGLKAKPFGKPFDRGLRRPAS